MSLIAVGDTVVGVREPHRHSSARRPLSPCSTPSPDVHGSESLAASSGVTLHGSASPGTSLHGKRICCPTLQCLPCAFTKGSSFRVRWIQSKHYKKYFFFFSGSIHVEESPRLAPTYAPRVVRRQSDTAGRNFSQCLQFKRSISFSRMY